MVIIALLAAIMCVLAPFSVPTGLIPISLGTFALYIITTVADRKTGTAAVILYILLGLVGVPVFTGWTGGFAKLAGPTGGYIAGYIPCAYISGLAVDKFEKRKWMTPLGLILGTAVLYAFGTAWFVIQANTNITDALSKCVLPFLIGDAVKIFVASAVAIPVRQRLKKFTLITDTVKKTSVDIK